MKIQMGLEVEIAYKDRGNVSLPDFLSVKGDPSIHGDSNHGQAEEFYSRNPVVFHEGIINKFSEDLKELFSLIDAGGNSSCGIHIHVSPADGWSDDLYYAVVALWSVIEPYFVLTVPSSRRGTTYCRWNNIDNNRLQQITKIPRHKIFSIVGEGRYRHLNFQSLDRHGSIEFRLFDSTHNVDTIMLYMRLCARFMNAVEEFAALQAESQHALLKLKPWTLLRKLGPRGRKLAHLIKNNKRR